jgi:hypothetical protein
MARRLNHRESVVGIVLGQFLHIAFDRLSPRSLSSPVSLDHGLHTGDERAVLVGGQRACVGCGRLWTYR